MKKILVILWSVFFSTVVFSQSYYRYNGKEVLLNADKSVFFVKTTEYQNTKESARLEMQKKKGTVKSYQEIGNNSFIIMGENLQLDTENYFSNIYRNSQNEIVIILPRIVMMLKEGGRIENVLSKYKDKLKIETGSKTKYILQTNLKKSDDILLLIEELSKREDVLWCEPEFLSNFKTNNTLYPQQYYLRNTGQSGGLTGMDINIEPAWAITNGNPNVTVAVIDEGVDRNHEDIGNRVMEGFTIRNPNGLGAPQNAGTTIETCKGHGVACAGIIAASNNTIGIRGVASNVRILPVNIVPDLAVFDIWGNLLSGGFGSNIEIAQAINWAWRRSDILSCSWGGGSPSNDITLAIDSARIFGRNGRGTVVVFAAGNNNPRFNDVSFPGNVNGVVTVGAVNNRGVIWNYSQRGASMDLVAPSGDVNLNGDVVTTDRMDNLGYNNTNYMANFGGTSAACPQVAGVAALMLSVRPDLTEAQVRTTLQNTARDLGTSGFDNTYGYGLVNAYAAVSAVAPRISGSTIICDQATYTIENLPAGATVQWSIPYSGAPYPQLTQNVPNVNQCTITNPYKYPVMMSLTARISKDGILLLTINKTVASDTNSDIQYGSYYQQSCTLYGTAYPVRSGNLDGNSFALYQSCLAVITLSDMFGKHVTFYSGYTPDYWNYDSNTSKMVIQLPLGSAGVPFIFKIVGEGACKTKEVMIWSIAPNRNYFSLFPNPATTTVSINLEENEETQAAARGPQTLNNAQTQNYQIQLWNSFGLVRQVQTNQQSYQLDLTGIPAGFYYVHVIKDGKTHRRQLIVK